jgi:hypothetical protein
MPLFYDEDYVESEAVKAGIEDFDLALLGEMDAGSDLSLKSNTQLSVAHEVLHENMLEDYRLASEAMTEIYYLTMLTIFFPISMFCKKVFANLYGNQFIITTANFVDMSIFILAIVMWTVVDYYKGKELKVEMFGTELDKEPDVKFLGNVIYDISMDIFHLDYLMAAITAALWFRCIILLRLTESFGPLLTMIYRMI